MNGPERVIDWFAKHSDARPDKVALKEVATGRAYTYREFNQQANRVAHLLEKLGVKAGDRVAVLSSNRAEVLFVLIGATKIGAIFMPLNFKLAVPELAAIVADGTPRVLFYSSEFAEVASTLERSHTSFERFVAFDGAPADSSYISYEGAVQQYSPERTTPIPVDMEAPQMLLYTSGTTGRPKGVIISHRMVFWNSINFGLRDLMTSDIVLVHTPMFYTGGLNVYTLPGFFLGATVVLAKTFQADEVLRTMAQEHVTVMFAVPTQLLMLADSPLFHRVDLSSLRYMISGGAPCPVPLIQRWIDRGVPFKQGMGLTEVGPNCFALETWDSVRKAGSVGFPNFCVEARCVDDDDRDVDRGQVGELIFRTPAMCSGYWNNPEATATAFRNGWFHTGDLVRQDDEGYWYIVDRKKDMFISGGENVYPAEIEHLIVKHPAVSEVAVIGIPHPKWGEVGCAAIVLKAGASASADEIIEFCRGKIAKFKIPQRVVFRSEIPKTVSAKVAKQDLKREFANIDWGFTTTAASHTR